MSVPDARCAVAGCRGRVEDGYCDVCGAPPGQGPARVAQSLSQLDAQALGSDRVGPDRPRRLSTSVSRLRVHRLGAGLTTVPQTPVADPFAALMADPVVPEERRVCSSCEAKVGQGVGDGAGRVEGFCQSCGTRFDFCPALSPGDLVAGQYEVVGCLAHGGQGWIYLARDRHLSDRPVVLKGLLNSGDANAVAAAIAERQFLAEVKHPLVVQVYNFVTHAGAGYLVMEYVGGMSAKQMLAARNVQAGQVDPLPVDQALAYVLEVLPALTYLHEQGLLYCDFKPANLICHGESVTLIDLGGVRRADDHQSPLFGTLGFQGPEVSTEGPSVASDVFTVGRTLATLVLDFKGNTTTYATSLPPVDQTPVFVTYDSFYRLLARACAFDPDDRFATVDELRVQMLGVLRDVVAIDRGLGRAARTTTTSKLFTAVPVEVAERPLLASELPALRPDERDQMDGWLSAVTETDPAAQLTVLANAPQTTAQVLATRAQVAIDAGWSARAREAVEELLELDPWDWRAAWMSGLAELSTVPPDTANPSQRMVEAVVAARASFNAVYRQVPGEAAPKLALATACELSGELAAAESLYLVCAGVDAGYTSVAAFGLARIRERQGDIAGALAALDLVSPSRGVHHKARAWHTRLAASAGSPGSAGRPGTGAPTRPASRSRRRRGISLVRLAPVDYQARPSSPVEHVDAVRRQVASGWTDGVQLSGITWQVLQIVRNHKVLLVSERVVGNGWYHHTETDITWERCSLRRWLNESFLDSLGQPLASQVPVTDVQNAPNPAWGTDGGPATSDRVFLLSIDEAVRMAGEGPRWKKRQRTRRFDSHSLCAQEEHSDPSVRSEPHWWLRSPGSGPFRAATISPRGSLSLAGTSVTTAVGLRPALWLSL
ncbi:MAG: serine/threonine-protein kinase PknG [Micrococcales bacterium]|nr:serine/threonine-protein kinase PknG [Micrococcales bacterium]MCL2667461.1 serine/threonine-protein kinase PknG [Micrococcales bacterium]